jgi:uncharacterized protein
MIVKKKTLRIIGLMIVLIAAGLFLFYHLKPGEIYQFKDGSFYYSKERGKVDYNIQLKYSHDSIDVYSVSFKSRNFTSYETTIYGLLFLPAAKKNLPGLVLLPGGGGTKEGESRLATIIAKLGYAVLTIDQRGVGQTGGYYLGPQEDYGVFANGNEPIQHLSVYDALRTFDVLREIKEVDKNNIAIAGESMGGRYAVIAGGMDNRLKGVIAISTSGFHVKNDNSVYGPYLLSIDPDHYVNKISPNYLMMLHGSNDSVVSLNDAKETFGLAKEPKNFFVAEGCNHGYCDGMHDELVRDLKLVFGK